MDSFNKQYRLLLAALMVLLRVFRNDAAVPFFIFGDSLVDYGNNNYINSLARANYLPNGLDYPTHNPTGRFCNGLTISDLISEYMGEEPVLPILDPNAKGNNLLRGANFASAGAGILDDTGAIFLQRLIFPQQIQLFQKYQSDVAQLIGTEATAKLIAQALYSVTIGGNDYINNYLLPVSVRARQYTPYQFNQLLIATFRNQLTQLYNLGARKITVSAIGPLGCIPSQLAMANVNTQCISQLNEYASDFNAALKIMLESLTAQLPGSTFVYTNGYDIIFDYIRNYEAYGFEASTKACCGQGSYNGRLVCTALSNLCPDRSKYIFWDPFHPTEAANRLITERIINGPPSDISPINLKQLLAL